MEYVNFDLWIQSEQGGCYKVTRPLSGTEECLCQDERWQRIQAGAKRLEEGETDGQFLKDFGSDLYECLLRGSIRDAFNEAFGDVRDEDDKALRIRLIIEPPEIAELPWELLYDSKRDRFLATWDKTSLTRYLKAPEAGRRLTVRPPIKVLVAIPEGSDLEVDVEEGIVREAFKELTGKGIVHLEFLKGRVTLTTVHNKLSDDNYHVFHFIGHGCFDNDEGYLRFNPDEGDGAQADEEDGRDELEKLGWLRADSFADLFAIHRSMKLVVLNSCQGAKVSATKPLAGLAPRLFGRDIPVVVAMQYPFYDDSAVIFSSQFYRKLCQGPERGLVDAAVTTARNLIRIKHRDDVDFATPVLFMHTPTGLIFDLKEDPAAAEASGTSGVSAIQTDVNSVGSAVIGGGVLRSLWRKVSDSLELLEEAPRLKALRRARGANVPALRREMREAKDAAVFHERKLELEEEQDELMMVEESLRRAAKVWTWLTWAALAVSLFIFASSFFGVFNLLGVDDWLQLKASAASRSARQAGPFGLDNIRIILADQNSKAGDFPDNTDRKNDRRYHAQLINALTDAGAKVVVLDLFPAGDSPWDSEFAEAVKRAVGKGTRAVVGVEGVKDTGEPDEPLPEKLQEVFRDSWGNYKVGISYELAGVELTSGNGLSGIHTVIRYVELAKRIDAAPAQTYPRGAVPIAPSLMLQAVRQFDAAGGGQPPSAFFYPEEKRVRLLGPDGHVLREIPVADEELSFMLTAAGPEDIGAIRYTYQQILERLGDAAFMRQVFQGKLVLVGYGVDEDRHYVSGVRQMYGAEIHANVISNIFKQVHAQKLPGRYNFLIILLMTLLGFLLQTRRGHRLRYGVRVEALRRVVKIPVALFVVVLLYFLAIYALYSQTFYVVDMSYHVVALFLAYWLAGLLRKYRKNPLKEFDLVEAA